MNDGAVHVPSVVACASGALTVAVGQTSPICSSAVNDDSVDPHAPIVLRWPRPRLSEDQSKIQAIERFCPTTAAEDETVGRSFTFSTSSYFFPLHTKKILIF